MDLLVLPPSRKTQDGSLHSLSVFVYFGLLVLISERGLYRGHTAVLLSQTLSIGAVYKFVRCISSIKSWSGHYIHPLQQASSCLKYCEEWEVGKGTEARGP